jgi:hypothetical protein
VRTLILILAALTPAEVRAAGGTLPPAERPSTPPLAARRESAPAPLVWEPGEGRRFLSEPGRVWLVTPETAVTGWAVGDGERREIRQTRLRIEERRDGRYQPLAWLQHVANTEVALLAPGDPRLADPGVALSDSLRPWPNVCAVSFYDLDRALDLNGNDRMELPVRFFATVAEPATGILLVEPDAQGAPRIVPVAELVSLVRFPDGVLTAIRWERPARDPVLEARLPSLHRCRFLSLLGIRGGTECETCCEIPVILHRNREGIFRPTYDPEVHRALLDRLRGDLALVQEGTSDPLASAEQAALARAASFFYLTGTAEGTGDQLRKALGPRADQPAALLLLRRLDQFFLVDEAKPE